jgi:hypothetical protein
MTDIVCYGDMEPQDAAHTIREDQKTHNEAREARFWVDYEREGDAHLDGE